MNIQINKRSKQFRTVTLLLLTLLYIIITLFHFYSKVQSREYEAKLDALKDLANQGHVIVENRIQGYITTLNAISNILQELDIHSDETLAQLAEIADQKELDFKRIGIANADGDSLVTNGSSLNIKNRPYFQESMNGRTMITSARSSVIVDEDIFIVSAPVKNLDQQVKGYCMVL